MGKIARCVLVALGLEVFGATACNHPVGPSLSAVVESQTLVPSSSVANAASICCCRVKGTVRNTSTIPVDVSLRFSAQNTRGQARGVAVDFLQGVAPGQRKSYDAAGIFEACSLVGRVQTDTKVTGLYTP